MLLECSMQCKKHLMSLTRGLRQLQGCWWWQQTHRTHSRAGPSRARMATPQRSSSLAAKPSTDAKQFMNAKPFVDAKPFVNGEPFVDAEQSVDAEPFIDDEPFVDAEPSLNVKPSVDAKLFVDAKPFEDMPGPGGLPFFGTYFKYKLGIVNVHKLFDEMRAWHQQYGAVFKEQCLGKTVVHVADPEATKTVYATEGRLPRIEPIAIPSGFYRQKKGIGLGLGNSNDEEWYRLRHSIQKLMMRPTEIVTFLPSADQAAVDFVSLLRSLRDENHQVPHMKLQLSRWILETFSAHCFDKRLGYMEEAGQEEAERTLAANEQLFDLLAELLVTVPLYEHTGLTTPKWSRLFAAEDFLYEVFEKHFLEALDRLKERTSSGQLGDREMVFLRHLMSTKDLEFKDVAILTQSLMIDPLSTVRAQSQYLLYLLATHPHVQQKLWEEVKAVIPPFPAPLTPSHLRGLRYFRACFKESVRLMPVINENKRFTSKDLVLGGYHVPANSLVFLNGYVLYRDPEQFPEPDAFLPERWLTGRSHQTTPDPFVVLPFSHGPRMCIGRRFAELEMAVMMTRLIQNFRVEWNRNLGPLRMRYAVLNFPDGPTPFTLHDR